MGDFAKGMDGGPSRRAVLGGLGAMVGGMVAPRATGQGPVQRGGASSFVDILHAPEMVRTIDGEGRAQSLVRSGAVWAGDGDVTVRCVVAEHSMGLELTSPTVAMARVHLRWRARVPARTRVLGDAWERSYGELGWQEVRPERAMPWYFLATDGRATHGYGVRVGAASFAFWQCDTEGISLWLDVRNGGSGVELGRRTLPMATVVSREGHRGAGHEEESAFAAARSFCQVMAAGVVLQQRRGRNGLRAVYGSNDWYYAYGKNSAEGIVRDAELMRELAPAGGPRPYTVIDDGWQHPERYGDMGALAEKIRGRGVAPGVWIRPLQAFKGTPPGLLLTERRFGSRAERFGDLAYDPTIPEAAALAIAKCAEAKRWGYELIKHDFSSYELLGQWGNEMGASPALAGWNLHDRSVTNAEVVRRLYERLRAAAGEETVVLGCNVVGHLSAGLFDLQRTGDDVSGRVWERTRRMGVNTLAFRLPQNGTFFMGDADCVPITRAVPWALTEQWLRAVAASGTALLVSPEPGAMGAEQKRAVREAFAAMAAGRMGAEPVDWMEASAPGVWRESGSEVRYGWLEATGASPFAG